MLTTFTSSAPLSTAGGAPQDHKLQEYLTDKKTPDPLGPPWDPRHWRMVGSYRGTSLIRNMAFEHGWVFLLKNLFDDKPSKKNVLVSRNFKKLL